MANVSRLINVINRTLQDMDLDSRKVNFLIDRGVISERLKQDHMFDVIKELEYLSTQKIQFIEHNFEQVKAAWKTMSETEIQSKQEYEESRASRFLALLI